MCLTVKQGSTYKVAEKDIIVYKVGKIFDEKFSPKYRNYYYIENEIQPKVKLENDFGQIYEGYHSYISLREERVHNRNSDEKIGRFTIPKGTLYIEGTFVGSKCYVSETIIYNGVHKRSLFEKFLQFFK